jgi:hypothetical protein
MQNIHNDKCVGLKGELRPSDQSMLFRSSASSANIGT